MRLSIIFIAIIGGIALSLISQDQDPGVVSPLTTAPEESSPVPGPPPALTPVKGPVPAPLPEKADFAPLNIIKRDRLVRLNGLVPSQSLRTGLSDALTRHGFHVVDHLGVDEKAQTPESDTLHALCGALLGGPAHAGLELKGNTIKLYGAVTGKPERTSLGELARRLGPGLIVDDSGLESVPAPTLRPIPWPGPGPEGITGAALSQDAPILLIEEGFHPSLDPSISRYFGVFQLAVDTGLIEWTSREVRLRGRVPELLTKMRLGQEARVVFGPNALVANFIRVASAPAPQPVPLIAQPSLPLPLPEEPTVATMAEPEPMFTLASAVPGPVPTPAAVITPTQAPHIQIRFGSSRVVVEGALPQTVSKTRFTSLLARVFDRPVATDHLSISAKTHDESWTSALEPCFEALAAHTIEGEFTVENHLAQLKGRAKDGSAKDRLLATVAKNLPNEIAIQDLMSASGKVSNLFSRDIYFNTGSTYIKPEHREHLREASRALGSRPDQATILIKGFADARGDTEINSILSRQRAKAVFDTMVANGVNPANLEFIGVGDSQAGQDESEHVWEHDRRVELTVVR